MFVQPHGFYSDEWQKQPLVWGFSGVVALDELNTNASAGTNQLPFDTVPADEVHMYYAVGAVNYTNVATVVVWSLYHGGTGYTFYRYLNIPAGYFFVAPNPTVCGPGDYLNVTIQGCVAGDTIRATATGYKMKLDL